MNIDLDTVRQFDVWFYTVGHSTLLLRSLKEKNRESGQRIHIYCTSTHQITLPTHFKADRIITSSENLGDHKTHTYSDSTAVKYVHFFHHSSPIGYIHADFIEYCMDNGNINDTTELVGVTELLGLGGYI